MDLPEEHIDIARAADLDPADARALSKGIIAFNRRTVPDLEPVESEVRFFALARDACGRLRGGLRASCFWNTLHIELLWLDVDARGRGTGRRLLAAAEARALAHGCALALVETTSWQARPFYEKAGYQWLATLPERPRGHATHMLSKRLIDG